MAATFQIKKKKEKKIGVYSSFENQRDTLKNDTPDERRTNREINLNSRWKSRYRDGRCQEDIELIDTSNKRGGMNGDAKFSIKIKGNFRETISF